MESGKRLIIILNGISRKKERFYKAILPELKNSFDVTVWETQHTNHGIELAQKAALEKPFGILAAGGDGTLNQVLNGVMTSEIKPTIGIIPLGTGNDFARMIGVTSKAENIITKIKGVGKPTDIGYLKCQSESGEEVNRFFINVASLGLGPDVVKRLLKSNRSLGPTITYVKAIVQSFFRYKPEEIKVKADSWSWEGKIRVLAIANGQSFGNALYIAPDAKPDDGLFATFMAGEIPLLKFLWMLQAIKSKKKIVDKNLMYNQCTGLNITSPLNCMIETEGELAGQLPASIQILPSAIHFFR